MEIVKVDTYVIEIIKALEVNKYSNGNIFTTEVLTYVKMKLGKLKYKFIPRGKGSKCRSDLSINNTLLVLETQNRVLSIMHNQIMDLGAKLQVLEFNKNIIIQDKKLLSGMKLLIHHLLIMKQQDLKE